MSVKRATPPLLKDLNERTVLETIRSAAPISRAEISRTAGISKPTVSQALQSLLGAGLVRETAHEGDGPSYGATFFEQVPEAAFVLGLDLGAHFVRGAVCDVGGEIRARQDVELREPTAVVATAAIVELTRALIAAAGAQSHRVDSVVLGVPGAVDIDSGRISLAINVAGLEDGDFRGELADALQLPLTIENDINLAALGERWRGVALGLDDFAFLSVGTGLGAGLVLRGELHRGHSGFAGEIDYARLGFDETMDPCADAVSAFAHSVGAPPPHDPRAIFAAARAGNPAALEVVEEEARRIALHIVPIAAVTDVGLIVLGGGIGANGDLLHDHIRHLLAKWLPSPPRVQGSSLGDAAVLTGALAIGLRAARENVFVNRTQLLERALEKASA
jgi:predicted NBD/HSP70 family sugar kinase